MATDTLEPPRTTEELRERAEQLRHDVDEALDTERFEELLAGAKRATRKTRVLDRERWFGELNRLIRSVTKSEAWRAHDLARELLVTRDDLLEAIEADPDATDPEWRERAALMRMKVVVEAMRRQLDHHAIDRPEFAAEFVSSTLADVGDGAVARLLGTTPRMAGKYRTEGVKAVRKNPERVTLVGQLVYELRTGRTPRGVLMWFDAGRESLGGQTPLELIEEDVAKARERLIPLARGGRGQLDQAGRVAVD